jgi:hypothetical protein
MKGNWFRLLSLFSRFQIKGEIWSLSRVSEFGYSRVHATKTDMLVQVSSSCFPQFFFVLVNGFIFALKSEEFFNLF